jgi:adenosine deaminase
VRTSIEHTFLPGSSLWRDPDVFKSAVTQCAQGTLGSDKPSPACTQFLESSEKASQQWELERRFRTFESEN